MFYPPSFYPNLICSGWGEKLKKGDWICLAGYLKESRFGRNDIIYQELGEVLCRQCFEQKFRRTGQKDS